MRIYAGMPGKRTIVIRAVGDRELDQPFVLDFDKEGYVDVELPDEISFSAIKSILPGAKKPKKTKTEEDEE